MIRSIFVLGLGIYIGYEYYQNQQIAQQKKKEDRIKKNLQALLEEETDLSDTAIKKEIGGVVG